MKSINRHLYAAIFTLGAYLSSLVGTENFVLDLQWTLVLLGITYFVALCFTYFKDKGSVSRAVLKSFCVYYLSFYVFWIAVGLNAELSKAAIPLAIGRLTLTFLIASPVVLFKLIPALAVSLALQYLFRRPLRGF